MNIFVRVRRSVCFESDWVIEHRKLSSNCVNIDFFSLLAGKNGGKNTTPRYISRFAKWGDIDSRVSRGVEAIPKGALLVGRALFEGRRCAVSDETSSHVEGWWCYLNIDRSTVYGWTEIKRFERAPRYVA